MNPEGRCFPFDSRGSGYGRGEGVATIILKRLDDALSSGDNIRTVIRHTGVNQDGKTAGIALPNQQAQESLVRGMYQDLDLDPLDVQYIEAHGTGTVAGDATEIKSISRIFCNTDRRQNPLYVGSVKSNIGHTECTSGLAGLIKTILILEKGHIPPNINLEEIKSSLKDQIQQITVSLPLLRFDHYLQSKSLYSCLVLWNHSQPTVLPRGTRLSTVSVTGASSSRNSVVLNINGYD